MANINELLQELNPAQRQAVEHPPQIPLQILAGPGSGKTKVLTMRIAHLIAHCYLPPWAICAVTFTNKAAKEMRERLVKLIGKDITAQIKMGTFHALCATFLRRYAKYVGIEGNFTVCDADESKKIILKLLKPFHEFLKEKNITLEGGTVQSMISKLKAKRLTADDALRKVAELNALSLEERKRRIMLNIKPELLEGGLGQVVATLYKNYEKILRESNSLDFDDLLLFGVKLFETHKKASGWCQHVLVDEYQDTNTTQYELMRYIAQTCRCVTIVGDPDQSIYGWRSAEIENLAKMLTDFPGTQQIFLEQNYRSTAAILAISMALISQDEKRIQKTLNTTHPQGPTTVLRAFPIEAVEAGFIAAEIKRLVAFAGGLLTYNDFVVLLRFNALSRAIESALRKEGIPSRVLAGHKFFERMEVKDVLAYLQLVDNPDFVPAFTRVVNVPSRSVGEKTVAELLHRAKQLKISPSQVVERIVEGKIPDIKPPVKKKLAHFAGVIRDMRKFANEGMSPSKLIQSLLDLISYGEHLRKTQPDYESRWDNVQELINFAAEVENNMPEDVGKKMSNAEDAAWEELWGDSLNEWDVDQVEEPKASQPNGDTPLRLFLQASMLSTDTETAEDDKNKEKVTISTCHAAKGLEWAVVMIPAVVDGVFPSSRAEDTDEELRLLYVACTRAQCLLYLSHTTTRMVAGESLPQDVSSFLANVRSNSQTRGLVSEELPALTAQDRTTFSRILNRPAPDEAEVEQRVSEYERTGRHPVWGVNAPFRDSASAPVNGYAVPARYGAVPGRALNPPQAGKPVYAQQQPQQPQPQRCLPQQEQKPKIERIPDNIHEPPLFMASSLVHFNNVHRAGVVQNAQPTNMVSSSSRGVAPGKASTSASVHVVNGAVPLTSSKSRVVNVAAPQSASGSNLRDWIVKTETHRAADADVAPSKSKGKARAVEPVCNVPAVKHEPGSSPVKMEPSESSLTAGRSMNSRLAPPPARARSDLPSGGPSRIKPEPNSGPRLVKMEPQSSSAAVTPSRARPGVSSGPSRVKLEPASDLVKIESESESSSSSSPLPSRQIKVAPTQMKVEPRHALEYSSSTRKQSSSVLGPVRHVQTSCIKVEAPLKSSPGEGLPSSSGFSTPASNIPTSSSSSPPEAPLSADAAAKPTSVKRRLGMGRATAGYSNKKFKPLIPNGS